MNAKAYIRRISELDDKPKPCPELIKRCMAKGIIAGGSLEVPATGAQKLLKRCMAKGIARKQ